MRISIDIDGVISNFNARMIEIAGLPKDYIPLDWDYSDVLTKDG